MKQTLVERHAAARVREALSDIRVVLIQGPRQAGKSTLAQMVLRDVPDVRRFTFDNPEDLARARDDPRTFFMGHGGITFVDEVQKAPELFSWIKLAVDEQQRPGAFLLTGSAQVLALPRLSDSLAGRMEPIELWTFSQGELEGHRERFVDELLSVGPEAVARDGELSRDDYIDRAVRGGFPTVVRRQDARSRTRWLSAYVTTLAQRDLADISGSRRLEEIPGLLRLVAAATAAPINENALAERAGLPWTTLRRYLGLLEAAFLIQRVPAWSGGRTTRTTRARKLYITDSGLLARLLFASRERLARRSDIAGPLLETFAVMELRRQLGWSDAGLGLYHYRTKERAEVDVVVEAADGRIAGIEIKAGATVRPDDFRALRHLSSRAGEDFVGGVVLYTGSRAMSFGGGMWALPFSALWTA